MSASPKWRSDLVSHCKNLIHSLALHTGATLQAAHDTCISDAEDLFTGSTFKAHLKSREAEFKLQAAVIGRLDAVIKGLGRR